MKRHEKRFEANNGRISAELKTIIAEIYLKGKKGKRFDLTDEVSLIRDLGFDSTEVLELIVQIEKKFSITIPDQDLRIELFDSVGSVRNWVENLAKG